MHEPNRDAIEFLQTAYDQRDWVAIFLKAYDTGRVDQQVQSIATLLHPGMQAWLAIMSEHRFNLYVSVNALRPHATGRRRADVASIRHIFLEADHDGAALVETLRAHARLPPPSYLIHSSPGRVHVFWRVAGFSQEQAEGLQCQLARELGTDLAATPSTQTTRVPGHRNFKDEPACLVRIEYGDLARRYTPADFPAVRPDAAGPSPWLAQVAPVRDATRRDAETLSRARAYLAAVPPAIAGQGGDRHTFRVCCRLARGFALSDDEALSLLREWNGACQPPWSDRELADKVRRARGYGHEPIGGLLAEAGPVIMR